MAYLSSLSSYLSTLLAGTLAPTTYDELVPSTQEPVEYLFFWPGIGFSPFVCLKGRIDPLGVSFYRRTAQFDPTLAAGLCLTIAMGFVVLDTVPAALRVMLDPRLKKGSV
ncbi:MAG: hypothetical protein AB1497_00870 [Bacillota bacterium]